MPDSPRTNASEERSKAIEGVGFFLGFSAVAVILLVLPGILHWGTTAQSIARSVALLAAAFGLFGAFMEFGKLLKRPSLNNFGNSAGLVALGSILLVNRAGFGIGGFWGGAMLTVAIPFFLLAVVEAVGGIAKWIGESMTVRGNRPTAEATEPGGHARPDPPKPLSREARLTILVTLFVGILTTAATLLAPLLD
jgi:hypothetical protein